MSVSIWYSIRSNEKTHYEVETLFFGKKLVYDFKKVFDTPIFDTYEECLKFIYEHKLINVHIRKSVDLGGGVRHTDYRTMFNVVYKGYDWRNVNSYPYNLKGDNNE